MSTDDLGPLPAVPARHLPVQRARHELLAFLIDWKAKHELTLAEELAVLSGEVSSILWGAVKSERRAAEEGET